MNPLQNCLRIRESLRTKYKSLVTQSLHLTLPAVMVLSLTEAQVKSICRKNTYLAFFKSNHLITNIAFLTVYCFEKIKIKKNTVTDVNKFPPGQSVNN